MKNSPDFQWSILVGTAVTDEAKAHVAKIETHVARNFRAGSKGYFVCCLEMWNTTVTDPR